MYRKTNKNVSSSPAVQAAYLTIYLKFVVITIYIFF